MKVCHGLGIRTQCFDTFLTKLIYPIYFHVSKSLVCHLLLVAQSVERSMMKGVFLWHWFQRDVHLFFEVENHAHIYKIHIEEFLS